MNETKKQEKSTSTLCQPSEKINHPSHYTWLKEACGVEVIDIARCLDFCLGNAIKYTLRAGRKYEVGYDNRAKMVEDLKKARWYIDDKIKQLENEQAKEINADGLRSGFHDQDVFRAGLDSVGA